MNRLNIFTTQIVVDLPTLSTEISSSKTNTCTSTEGNNSCTPSQEIVWSREEDKIILETFQKDGYDENIFNEISKRLQNRSVASVEKRFQTLMQLLQEMTSNS